MLVAAAVCPCPPLLVPEVAASAAPELDEARAACEDALGVLAAARPDLLVVVGPTGQEGRGEYPEGATGSFRGFGVARDVVLGGARAGADIRTDTAAHAGAGAGRSEGGNAQRELPASLAVAAWLLERVRWSAAPVWGLGVGEPLATDRCVQAGKEIAARSDRVALLVMGDGSACRTLKAPGYLDERAAGFDEAVARALAAADAAALKALDAELAYDLKAAGRAPWQLLAGAADDVALSGELLYEAAPYGVGYFVAAWT
ncbi:class III extradiol dioxygenase subunit B-like domain-containing protein [Streptomyces odonnellii]|uniref:class III extradiol dioxygenase subunit B-like domain-containing protein n=1 Tax=Streptomyces odonnellii TaxID=1417980 RepID=UPI0006268925|nr:class III extradiol dioxygenase subunit B-like domain-containing protein [Streptomyces odonnellii]